MKIHLSQFRYFPCIMGSICLQCGDRGFVNAFIYCVKCLDVSVHRYCLDVIPETFDEFVFWVCDHCNSNPPQESVIPLCNFSECETWDNVVTRNITTAGNKDPIAFQTKINNCERGPLNLCSAERTKSHKNLKKKRKAVATTLSFAEADLEEQRNGTSSVQSLQKNKGLSATSSKRNLMSYSKYNDGKGDSGSEEEREESISQCTGNLYSNLPNDLSNKTDILIFSQPVINPIWSGDFSIWNKKDNTILNGLLAHVSNKACQRVYDETACLLPLLHLEMLPKSSFWPKCFEISEPTDENIALYFFPSDKSESNFDLLVDEMTHRELAMKTLTPKAELLVFSSLELPLSHWRFNGKNYLWGVFKGKKHKPPDLMQ